MMNMMIRPIFLVIFFISLVSGSAPAQEKQTGDIQADDQFELISEDWYTVFIDGVKSGWSSQLVYSNQDHYKTSMEQHMTLSRGGINISIAVSSDFLETHAGVPVQINTTQEALSQVSKSSWTFKGNEIMRAERQTIAHVGQRPEAYFPRELFRPFRGGQDHRCSSVSDQRAIREAKGGRDQRVLIRNGVARLKIQGFVHLSERVP